MAGDLVAFLKARLDEDAAAATAAIEKSAAPPEWRKGAPTGNWRPEAADYGDGTVWKHMPWEIYDGDLTLVSHQAYEGGGISAEAVAAHIARHDPARVLREVEAKRPILAEHSPGYPTTYPKPSGQPACAVCDEGTWDTEPVRWPCPTIRHLAAVYSTHPGYDPAWAPDQQYQAARNDS